MELLAAFRVIGLPPEITLYMFYVSWKIPLTFVLSYRVTTTFKLKIT